MRLRRYRRKGTVRRLAVQLARRLTPQQAQEALGAVRQQSVLPLGKIQTPAEIKAEKGGQPKDKLREALKTLTPEQAKTLPPSVAKAILEGLGYDVSGQPSQSSQPASSVEEAPQPSSITFTKEKTSGPP